MVNPAAALARPRAVRYSGFMPFSPYDLERLEARRRRFRLIPVRTLLPNLITLLALCAGLTAIRLAVEGKLEWAVSAIVFAALLDGVDGRIARMLKGTSRFGAELDSLADFVNFGVAPALILYFWGLHELGNGGWIAAMVFAICTGLRLARFNVMIDDPNRPIWAGNFFTGVPAPAGAITVRSSDAVLSSASCTSTRMISACPSATQQSSRIMRKPNATSPPSAGWRSRR